jgi:hypothetical protein
MATYVLVYKGGHMPETDEERGKVMKAWDGWFHQLGDAVVDGGNPFGPSRSVSRDGGVTEGGGSQLSGYSIIRAQGIDAAVKAATECPVLLGGASIEVYVTIDVMAAIAG